mmetsp:Transcript_37332/g.79236  ORF Transcript_37332/g.79236 Transcript_37332/m.79236 type:complete len:108 (-) Transcript_37332:52-375(-)
MSSTLVKVAAGSLVAVNGGTAGLFWYDKNQAQGKGWRVSENALCMTALFGGWPAGYLSMQTFRHKSVKKSFQDKYAAATCASFLWLGAFHPTARARLLEAWQKSPPR